MSERVTVRGVDAPCDKEKLSDMRFILMLGDLDDESLADSEKLATLSRLTRFLFGGERDAVLDALADGGKLEPVDFSSWLADFMKAAGAKN